MQFSLVLSVVFVAALSGWLASARSHGRKHHSQVHSGDNVQGHNPEAKLNASQLIAYRGYRGEEYRIQTDDGYLIYIQRIPCGKNDSRDECSNRPVVVLQHGLEGCSANWLTNPEKESLAYVLADAGYDVWLGNMRGNFYGQGHIKFPINSAEFWDFSFDEMAEFDLPAIINKALSVSGQEQVTYIGHSEGTLVGFSKFSIDVEFSKKVKLFIALAPVAYLGHLKSLPLRALAPYAKDVDFLLNLFGDRDFFSRSNFINHIGEAFCAIEPAPAEICANVVFLFAGYDRAQLNNSRIDIYIAHNPSGTSTQNIFHFAQLVDSDKNMQAGPEFFRTWCQMFDYGSRKANMKHYGQPAPPQYPLTDIEVPTVLMYGDGDFLATVPDVMRLKKDLKSLVEAYEVPFGKWDHLDFIWGIDAHKYVYNEVLRLLAMHT